MKFRERLRSVREDEAGAGLVSVIGVSMIVFIVIAMIASTAFLGVKVTDSRLALQQATDAAESGISEAVANIAAGDCKVSGVEDEYKYSYEIYRSSNDLAPTSPDAENTDLGCPIISDKWVMVSSEGTGRNGATKTIVATYRWNDVDVAVIPQTVSAKNLYINDSTVSSAAGIVGSPSIVVNSGDFNCDLNSSIEANVNINTDDAYTTFGNCRYNGNISNNLDSKFPNAEVYGDVCTSKTVSNKDNVMGDVTESSDNCEITNSMFGYNPSLSNSVSVTGDQCTNSDFFLNLLQSQTDHKFINVTECGESFSGLSSPELKEIALKTDITVVGKSFDVNNIAVEPLESGSHSLNFVVPSGIDNSSESTCVYSTASNFKNMKYSKGSTGIIYSGCSLSISDSEFAGQIYSGENAEITKTKIYFSPIALRGIVNNFSYDDTTKALVRVS